MTLRARVLILLGVVVAVAAVVVAVRTTDTSPVAVTGTGVEGQRPPPGTSAFKQQRVAIDLEPEYTAGVTMQLVSGNRVFVIPDDQLDHDPGLNTWTFVPAEGKVLQELPPQEVCAVVTYRAFDQPSTQTLRSQWCFDVSA